MQTENSRELHQMTAVNDVFSPNKNMPQPGSDAIDGFCSVIQGLLKEHRPSRMPFFRNLAELPFSVASDPLLLGQIHLVYQSAMHATRSAVYNLPHLDSPALRQRKLQILVDDDGLPGGDTHHYQLTRAFLNIGAKPLLADERFGDLDELCDHLEGETLQFVKLARRLYSRSLGPWCAIEVMSVDWMRALAEAFSVHYPLFIEEPYFSECFSQQVEERHAAEALEITQMILSARPNLLEETLRDAKQMAEALDGVWRQLDRFVNDARRRTQQDRALETPNTCRFTSEIASPGADVAH
jgi:pyrroloquinoline quinone (PQQ) biosynthesis protein C